MRDPWIDWLPTVLGKDAVFERTVAVGGGCINEAKKAIGKSQAVFIKRHPGPQAGEMFAAEAKGLDLLRSQNTGLVIPAVLYSGRDFQGYHTLILEWIDPAHPEQTFWEHFGRCLAALHQISNEAFGLDHPNYIGQLPQPNDFKSHWADFYMENRIIFQLEMGIRNGIFSKQLLKYADSLWKILESSFPKEVPALLHGDLWSGNFICSHSGDAVLIDPAVYFGNRETEMAFTRLFGGFDSAFYGSYNEIYPLQEDFKDRMDAHQLYPLLVHANLFGGGYTGQCKAILEYYGR